MARQRAISYVFVVSIHTLPQNCETVIVMQNWQNNALSFKLSLDIEKYKSLFTLSLLSSIWLAFMLSDASEKADVNKIW